MAGTKQIKTRMKSVRNTRKITRTMEMVSTAKSKRMTDRTNAAKPYGEKIAEMMGSLASLKDQVDSPLLRSVENPRKVALIVVTANRGLCGGYNSNTLKLARIQLNAHHEAGREVEIHVIGKKGAGYFKFLKIPVAGSYLEIDDRVTFEQAAEFVQQFVSRFEKGELDKVEIVSTIFFSSARQSPGITPILPVGMEVTEELEPAEGIAALPDVEGYIPNITYEPDPAFILERLLPLVIKTVTYRALLEASTSEQIYRRIAMKNATDAAGEMIKLLTRYYNRKRQATITQEISEIVAGADAI